MASARRVPAPPDTFLVKPGGEVAGIAHGPQEWDSREMLALLETLSPPAAPSTC